MMKGKHLFIFAFLLGIMVINAFKSSSGQGKFAQPIDVPLRALNPAAGLHNSKNSMKPQSTKLYLDNREGSTSEVSKDGRQVQVVSAVDYAWALVVLPLASMVFPYLLDQITNLALPAAARQTSILELLLAKRVYIYALALSTVALAAKRSFNTPAGLGQRIQEINGEVFEGIAGNYSQIERESNKELYEALDSVEGSTQAVALPFIFGTVLALSFGTIAFANFLSQSLLNTPPDSLPSLEQTFPFLFELSQSIKQAISSFIPSFTILSNAAVCWLFTKTELQGLLGSLLPAGKGGAEAGSGTGGAAPPLALGLALAATAGAVLSAPGGALWPAQNFVNVCVAVTVARAIQFPRLPLVLLALGGLAAYDVVAVLGTQQFTDGGASVMEAVAMAKLSSSAAAGGAAAGGGAATAATAAAGAAGAAAAGGGAPWWEALRAALAAPWRPGLFEVAVNGRVTDALGLGDVIFPAALAGWALRFDAAAAAAAAAPGGDAGEEEGGAVGGGGGGGGGRGGSFPRPYFGACLGGYALGCVLCEVFQTGQGQPALLYIVPAMAGALGAAGAARGQLGELWAFDAAAAAAAAGGREEGGGL